jgi:hypothetical protein
MKNINKNYDGYSKDYDSEFRNVLSKSAIMD